MFKLLTIAFLIISIIHLFKKGLFQQWTIKIHEELLKVYNENPNVKNDDKELISYGLQILVIFLFAVTIFIIKCFYLMSAYNYDVYKYPTLIIMSIIIINILRTFLKKSSINKIETMDDKKYNLRKSIESFKKTSFFGFIFKIVYIAYYGYIFYILFLQEVISKLK